VDRLDIFESNEKSSLECTQDQWWSILNTTQVHFYEHSPSRLSQPYSTRKLELESNLNENLPVNCKFICYSTPN